MGKAFIFALARQHPIALEIWGWDCVSPHRTCMPWGRQGPAAGRGGCYQGFGCVLQHSILQAMCLRVLLLHLGSTKGH